MPVAAPELLRGSLPGRELAFAIGAAAAVVAAVHRKAAVGAERFAAAAVGFHLPGASSVLMALSLWTAAVYFPREPFGLSLPESLVAAPARFAAATAVAAIAPAGGASCGSLEANARGCAPVAGQAATGFRIVGVATPAVDVAAVDAAAPVVVVVAAGEGGERGLPSHYWL